MTTVVRRIETQPSNFHGILTVSAKMKRYFELLEKAARSEVPILIRGETGTGKELSARAVHRISEREGRFEALNCATLTPELLASELFGHVKGAFTGAIRNRPGLFRLADRGTLFLDEIGEMPLDIQARVLRVLQEQRFVPLGGSDAVSVDVRTLSATHRALREAVRERRFREDLMFRVRVIPVFLPPLRERDGDIEALTWAFVDALNAKSERKIEAFRHDAFDALMSYHWPGNVRELRNVVLYTYTMGDGPYVDLESLPPELLGEDPEPMRETADDEELGQIQRALAESNGQRGLAAERLGMSRSTLWRKMREYRIS